MSDFSEKVKDFDFKDGVSNSQNDINARKLAAEKLTQLEVELKKGNIKPDDFESYFQRIKALTEQQGAEYDKLSEKFEQAKKIVLAISFYSRKSNPEEITFIKNLVGIQNSDGTVNDDMILAVMKYQIDNSLTVDGMVGKDTLSKFVGKEGNGLKVINENGKGKIVKMDGTAVNTAPQGSKEFPLIKDIKGFTGDATIQLSMGTYVGHIEKGVCEGKGKLIEKDSGNVFDGIYKSGKPFEGDFFDKNGKLLGKSKNGVYEAVSSGNQPQNNVKDSQGTKTVVRDDKSTSPEVNSNTINYTGALSSETKVYLAETKKGEKFYVLIGNTGDNTQKIQLAEKFAKDKNVNVRVDLYVGKYFISPTGERISSPSSLSNGSINDNDILSKKGTKILSVDSSYSIKSTQENKANGPTKLGPNEGVKTVVDAEKTTSYLKKIGYMIEGNEKSGFTTIDGDKLKTLAEVDAKTKEISGNVNLEKKYSLLKELKDKGFSPDFKKGENRYELDFYGLFDDSSIKFDGSKATITTSLVKGKEFVLDITKGNEAMQTITNINEYAKLNQELSNIENGRRNDSSDGGDSEIQALKAKISNLSSQLGIKK